MPDFMEFFISDEGTATIVAETLERVAKRVVELEPAFEEIFADMLITTETQIKSGGRRGGGSFAQLKEGTVRKKGSTQILYTNDANPKYSKFGNDTLVRSVTEAEAPYQVFQVTHDTLVFGTDRPFAEVIQLGSAKKNIPARPFLRIIPSDVTRWNEIMARYFLAPLREDK